MRYLYHKGEKNLGPVNFEQLQKLAESGEIDNMTPVLAEGATAWSRWFIIKEAPQPEAAPTAAHKAEKPAVAAAPTHPAEKTEPAEEPKTEKPTSATPLSEPIQPAAPIAPSEPASRAVDLLAKLPAFNPVWLIDGAAALMALLSLIFCIIWHVETVDARHQSQQLSSYAALQASHRPDIRALEQELQDLRAQEAETKSALDTNRAKMDALKKELNKLGSPETGTAELDNQITAARDKAKDIEKQASEINPKH